MILSADRQNITKAASLLRSGELLAFPTETVYGLGADAGNDHAIQKIFALKGRPTSNPLIVHLASVQEAYEICKLDLTAKMRSRFDALSNLWPGPVSLIVPRPAAVSLLVTAAGPTLAVRVPQHPIAHALLSEVKRPIAAPSANKSFAISPTSAAHVAAEFGPDLRILDGGACEIGLESTVIDITTTDIRILRLGAITAEMIRELLPADSVVAANTEIDDCRLEILPSPGLFGKHYAPSTPLRLIKDYTPDATAATAAYVAFSREEARKYSAFFGQICIASETGNLREVAKNLYASLRQLDTEGFDFLVCDCCAPLGIGAAIMDRLNRAAK